MHIYHFMTPSALHNVYIGQSCTPVSKIPPMWDTGVYFVAHVGYTVNIPKMYPSVHWTLGYIFEKITDLEFEVHKNIFLYEFLAIEQAGTNICWMGYQDTNFKICLSLFGCEELKLHKQHIVHWSRRQSCEKDVIAFWWFFCNCNYTYNKKLDQVDCAKLTYSHVQP